MFVAITIVLRHKPPPGDHSSSSLLWAMSDKQKIRRAKLMLNTMTLSRNSTGHTNGQELSKVRKKTNKRLTNISTHGVHVGKLYLLSMARATGTAMSVCGRQKSHFLK